MSLCLGAFDSQPLEQGEMRLQHLREIGVPRRKLDHELAQLDDAEAGAAIARRNARRLQAKLAKLSCLIERQPTLEVAIHRPFGQFA